MWSCAWLLAHHDFINRLLVNRLLAILSNPIFKGHCIDINNSSLFYSLQEEVLLLQVHNSQGFKTWACDVIRRWHRIGFGYVLHNVRR